MTTSQATLAAAASLRDDEHLSEMLRAFRLMLLEHGRIIVHRSHSLDMGSTDIRALAFISSVTDGTTPKQVAEFLELTTGATTSLVDRLVGAGTLVREAHPTDRRSVILQPTPEGLEVVSGLADVYRRALATAVPEGSYAEMTAVFRDVATALAAESAFADPPH